MTLTFPNAARSYDEAGKRVRFLGHDGMFEIRFFVEIEAFAKALSRAAGSEKDYLAAFDALRGKILDAARSAYSSNRKNTIVLTAGDIK
ncbi:DUF1488 domain-containing protein [Pararhizobium sp.]|uniref:DUF1488 domain-containing protein n=1 Tax=Pararhizobium sp. TaxID=1977563 RepID=UPI00272608E2|nr:DUF1488 domain-containing protein [Pararhizobium sp.]MDO9417205.1 DUF1488 domain-containing protein [Pararhizobium sp.]